MGPVLGDRREKEGDVVSLGPCFVPLLCPVLPEVSQLFGDGCRTVWAGHMVEMLPLWQVRTVWNMTPRIGSMGQKPDWGRGWREAETKRDRDKLRDWDQRPLEK